MAHTLRVYCKTICSSSIARQIWPTDIGMYKTWYQLYKTCKYATAVDDLNLPSTAPEIETIEVEAIDWQRARMWCPSLRLPTLKKLHIFDCGASPSSLLTVVPQSVQLMSLNAEFGQLFTLSRCLATFYFFDGCSSYCGRKQHHSPCTVTANRVWIVHVTVAIHNNSGEYLFYEPFTSSLDAAIMENSCYLEGKEAWSVQSIVAIPWNFGCN